ncbi:hypothetical protein [Actinacidiphila acidipaludis]|uniref:Uncharacterized protein n=1 Tax=Actinacidiphila acidipaludis TaxID=2873382 RepID=A0ABS7Q393_9ACTN|nr:hypothetical protein [Streptomyces acidipaludis]MBY8877614.1 hypothetical protein [Streptomyces acidipaludis]
MRGVPSGEAAGEAGEPDGPHGSDGSGEADESDDSGKDSAAHGSGAEDLTDDPAAPSYADLVAAAGAQWAAAGWDPRKVRPERDVREVPWWRVRSLRTAPLTASVVAFLFVVAASTGGAFADWGSGRSLWGLALTVLIATGIAHEIFQGVRNGAALARAARSPFAEIRRYVTVWHAGSGSLCMALFPRDCGQEDVPEALLHLSSGLVAGRRHGYPAVPVGETELHSDPDRPDLVVPWCAGRPVWTSASLVTVDLADPDIREGLRGLTSPAAGPVRGSLGRRVAAWIFLRR